jgi:hypothetical protein
MEYYWELLRKDGTRVEIAPSVVPTIQKLMDKHAPIHTKFSGTILYAEIASFRPTDKPFRTQNALEEASRAFNEPLFTDEGVLSRWVKKEVPSAKWEKVYAPNGYARLGESSGYVTIAWRLPAHLVDLSKYNYCNESEIKSLERKS